MANQHLQSTNHLYSGGRVWKIDDLGDLLNILQPVAHKCIDFGIQLGVKDDKMQAIEQEYTNPSKRLREILRYYLRQTPLTTNDIVQALKSNSVQEKQLANEFESQCTSQPSLLASSPMTCTQTPIHPSPSMLHSASQLVQQPNTCERNTQYVIPAGHVQAHIQGTSSQPPQLLQPHPHPPQYSSSSPPHHLAFSYPQTGTTQSSSSFQPYSSQLMSLPLAHPAMDGLNSQLNHHVATPPTLEEDGQQTSQGQQPQHVLQPQAVVQSHVIEPRFPSSQPEPEEVAVPRPELVQLLSSEISWRENLPSAHPHFCQGTPCCPQVEQREPPQLQLVSSCKHQAILNKSHGNMSVTGPSHRVRVHYVSPMAQYIDYIKIMYKQTVIEKKSAAIKWPPTPSTVYINLVCVDQSSHVSKEEADECTRAMVCDGSMDVILKKKRTIDFNEIVKDVPANEKKVIVIEGAPGVGKSTFAWEFCRRWERGEIAQQYQLVLLLRLRDERMSKAQSLADLIYHPSKSVGKAVEDDLITTLGANTLIFLEGFDELPNTCRSQSSVFLQLIHGQLLPLATVLVSSRPWATQVIHSECRSRIFQHIEILGFTDKQIKEYVTSVLGGKQKPFTNMARDNVEDIMSYIKRYPQIKASMYIPLNSAIVVSVYQESKAGKCILPKTLTELYYSLIQTLLLRYLYGHSEYGKKKWKIQSFKEDLPQDVHHKLMDISKLAYSGICSDQHGGVQLIYSNISSDFETLGLMQSVPQLYVTQGEDMSYNFLHLTVQEFLAALHISNMCLEKQMEHFQKQGEGRWSVVLKFLAGISKLANFTPEHLRSLIPERVDSDIKDLYHIKADMVLVNEHVNWMFEAQTHELIPLILQERTVEFVGDWWLTLMDYYSLGYCIVHSHSHWVLTLSTREEEEVIGEEEMKMLTSEAKSGHNTVAKVVGLRGEYPLSISPGALNMLFTVMKNVIHLQELHLHLPVNCACISWPNLSGLLVLNLEINGGKSWELDLLLPYLSLESLAIKVSGDEGSLCFRDVESIGALLISSKCPRYVHIEEMWYVIEAKGASQHMDHKHLEGKAPLVQQEKPLQHQLQHYSLGYFVVHSLHQWVLQLYWMGEDEVKMLVAGTKTRHETLAKIVALRGHKNSYHEGGDFDAMEMSAEVLNMLFTELEHVLHLQELHLSLPLDCCSISWPNLSGLQILHLNLHGERNWRLDTLLPHLSLESLKIELFCECGTTLLETCGAIALLLSSSICLKQFHFHYNTPQFFKDNVGSSHDKGMKKITKAMCGNKSLPLNSLVIKGWGTCVFSDNAAHSLAQCIANSAFLHHFSIEECSFNAHGLLELARAMQHNSNLQRKKLKDLTCTVEGDDEATNFRQLSVDYPYVRNSLRALIGSFIDESGVHAIAAALNHSSSLDIPYDKYFHDMYIKLRFSSKSISKTGAAALAWAVRGTSGLRKLDLSDNNITDAVSVSLSPALYFRSALVALYLGNNSIGDAGSIAIAGALYFNSTLTTLNLSNNCITDAGSSALVQSFFHNSTLCSLDLSYNSICDTRLETSAQTFPHNSSQMHDTGSTTLAQTLLWLRSLNLSHNNIKGAGSKTLALAFNCKATLSSLDMSSNGINDAGTTILSEALRHTSTLRHLYLSNSSINDTKSAALAQALHNNSTLLSLDLSNNNIGNTGSTALAQSLHLNSTLTTLNLSNNNVGDTGSIALGHALYLNSTLNELNLPGNSISHIRAAALAHGLHHNSTLLRLDLSNNSISDIGVSALAQAIRDDSALSCLNLSDDSICDGACVLTQALQHRFYFQMNLSNNCISDIGVAALAEVLCNSSQHTWDLSGNTGISANGTKKLIQVYTSGKWTSKMILPKTCEMCVSENLKGSIEFK